MSAVLIKLKLANPKEWKGQILQDLAWQVYSQPWDWWCF